MMHDDDTTSQIGINRCCVYANVERHSQPPNKGNMFCFRFRTTLEQRNVYLFGCGRPKTFGNLGDILIDSTHLEID